MFDDNSTSSPFLEYSLDSLLILDADRSTLSTPPLPSPTPTSTEFLTPTSYRDTQSILWDSRMARFRYQEDRKDKYLKISQRAYSTTGKRFDPLLQKDGLNSSIILPIQNPFLNSFNTLTFFTSLSISVQHDQLRSLLYSPNAHSLIYPNWGNLWEWDPIGCGNPKMIVEGRRFLGEGHRISTCYADADYCIIGGFFGEMISIKRNSGHHGVKQEILSTSSNPILTKITKHVDDFIISLNDGQVVFSDLDHSKRIINVGSSCNVAQMIDSNLLAVGMDSPSIPLIDRRTEERVHLLEGHQGSIFDVLGLKNYMIVSCGDDYTCHFWDLRMTNRAIKIIGSQMSPIRTLRESPDSTYLAAMEDCDYVSLIDLNTFDCKIIDFFGETAGICWSGDDTLHIGCSDLHLGGIITVDISL